MGALQMLTTRLIHKSLIILYVFYIIYYPVFSSSFIFSRYPMFVLLTIGMLLPYIIKRDKSILRLLSNRYLYLLMLFVLSSSVYVMVVQVLNDSASGGLESLGFLQNNIINLMIINAAIAVDQLRKLGYTSRKSFELLLKLGAFQGIVSILGLIIPGVKALSVSLYYAAGGSNIFVVDSRIFGISGDFTFGTPIYHGLLAGLALYSGIKYGRNYYGYIALILLATFVNGRTGLIAFVLLAISTILYFSIKKGILKVIPLAVTILLTTVMLFGLVGRFSPSTYNFVNSFISDTESLIFDRELEGNYAVLNDSFRLPTGTDLLTGNGNRVYVTDENSPDQFRSDIGYVNDIYMGGLLYALSLYSIFFIYLLHRPGEDRFIILTVISILLLVNIKGEIYRASSVLFLLVYLKMLMDSKTNRIKV